MRSHLRGRLAAFSVDLERMEKAAISSRKIRISGDVCGGSWGSIQLCGQGSIRQCSGAVLTSSAEEWRTAWQARGGGGGPAGVGLHYGGGGAS